MRVRDWPFESIGTREVYRGLERTTSGQLEQLLKRAIVVGWPTAALLEEIRRRRSRGIEVFSRGTEFFTALSAIGEFELMASAANVETVTNDWGNPIALAAASDPDRRAEIASRLLRELYGTEADAAPWFSQIGTIDQQWGPETFLTQPPRSFAGVAGEIVSVIVVSRDPSPTLLLALSSLSKQSHTGLEIVVVDDYSRDEAVPLFRQAEAVDVRIRVVRNDQTPGVFSARWFGITQTRGAMVMFHDDDDWSHPRQVELQLRALLIDRGKRIAIPKSIRLGEDGLPAVYRSAGCFFENGPGVLIYRSDIEATQGDPLWRSRAGGDDLLVRSFPVEERAYCEAVGGGPLLIQKSRLTSVSGRDFLFNWTRSWRVMSHGQSGDGRASPQVCEENFGRQLEAMGTNPPRILVLHLPSSVRHERSWLRLLRHYRRMGVNAVMPVGWSFEDAARHTSLLRSSVGEGMMVVSEYSDNQVVGAQITVYDQHSLNALEVGQLQRFAREPEVAIGWAPKSVSRVVLRLSQAFLRTVSLKTPRGALADSPGGLFFGTSG